MACAAQESFEVLLGDGENKAIEYVDTNKAIEDVSDESSVAASIKAQSRLEQMQKERQVRDIDEDDDGDGDSVIDENQLSWRSDPTLSLSDWTVQVTVKGAYSSKTYNVHKSILAVGPKRSNYFATTFLKQQVRQPSNAEMEAKLEAGGIDPCDFFQESMSMAQSQLIETTEYSENTTKLEMEQLAADAFPALLDFLYSADNELDITSENATALHTLAARLEMKLLRKKAKEFWNQDLSMETFAVYYVHSRIFRDEKISAFVEEFCAKNIFQTPENQVVQILSSVDPQFFLKIVAKCGELHRAKTRAIDTTVAEAARMDDEEGPLRLSLLVAVYGNIHKNVLSPVMFQRLTHEMHLPILEVKAAKVLLGLEDDICGTSAIMTPLKNRAIEVIAKTWQESCFETPPPAVEGDEETAQQMESLEPALPRLDGSALVVFTGEVLKEAKLTSISLSKELESLRKLIESTADVEKVEKSQGKEREELEATMDNEKDEQLEALANAKDLAEAKDSEIAQLKQQLKQQSEKFETEKKHVVRVHNEALEDVRNEAKIKLLEQKVELKKESAKERNELLAELSQVRRQLATAKKQLGLAKEQVGLAKDKLKLQQIAEEGASAVLKSSRDPQVEEKKVEDDV